MDESSGDSKQSPMAHSQDSFGVATLVTTTPGLLPTVYRGKKGSFHTKQKNPRTVVETDWHQKFVEICCDGDDGEADRLLNRYFLFNGNPATKKQAEGVVPLLIPLYYIYVILPPNRMVTSSCQLFSRGK